MENVTDLNSRVCNDLKRHGVIAVGRHSRGREIVLKKESRSEQQKIFYQINLGISVCGDDAYLCPDDNPVVIYDFCVVLEDFVQVGCGVDSVIHCCLYKSYRIIKEDYRLFVIVGLAHPFPHTYSQSRASILEERLDESAIMDNVLIHVRLFDILIETSPKFVNLLQYIRRCKL